MAVCAVYCAAVLLWPLGAVQASLAASQPVAGTSPELDWPSYGQSAIGAEGFGLLANQTDPPSGAKPVPIASITKLVTALTVLEARPLKPNEPGPTITFTDEDVARYRQYASDGGSVAAAQAGMTISQFDMLQAMLVISANNYADTLAIWAFDSLDTYRIAAADFLKAHELHDTHIVDATGFSPRNTSTAADLVTLGQLALDNPVIAEIVAKKSVTIAGVGTLTNTNILLDTPGVRGIKTGTTDEAGSCLLFAATYPVGDQEVTLIGTTLGAPNHAVLATNARTLLQAAHRNFQERELAAPNEAFATYRTPWGAQVSVVADQPTSAVVWAGDTQSQRVLVSALKPGRQPGIVGTATFTIGTQSHRVNLKTTTALHGPSIWWRLTHPQLVFR